LHFGTQKLCESEQKEKVIDLNAFLAPKNVLKKRKKKVIDLNNNKI
jgi:hypothetical protein